MILRRCKLGQSVQRSCAQSLKSYESNAPASSSILTITPSCSCSNIRQAHPVSQTFTQIRKLSTQESNGPISHSPIPVFNKIADFRAWRMAASAEGKRVGFVPTMGALHEGHLSLVQRSLHENDETVVSIFVNPAQFAPSEDLSSYPRTLATDIQALSSISAPSSSNTKQVSAIFAPTVSEMYPSPDGRPFTQHVKDQVGAFVEVQGLQDQMEGSSRPTFFRGVTTVCTKLFHIVEPNLAYFGQKDIQQAIILRRLVSDLLFSHPPSAQAIRVLKTTRDKNDGLALSSRNAYLTSKSRIHASVLFKALCAGRDVWERHSCTTSSSQLIQETLRAANQTAKEAIKAAEDDDVSIELLYISLNDPVTLQDLLQSPPDKINRGAILSAAALIKQGQQGRITRLIDNFLLGFHM